MDIIKIIINYVAFILTILILGYLLIGFGIISLPDSYDSSDWENNIGYQLCPASVRTRHIYCKSRNEIFPTYNATQKELENYINSCRNWEVREGWRCIKKRLII